MKTYARELTLFFTLLLAKLGWAYALPDDEKGLWLWKREMGWLWTQPGVYPYLWAHRNAGWLRLLGTSGGKPVFRDYLTGSLNQRQGNE